MKLVGGWTFIKDNLEVKHVVIIRKQWLSTLQYLKTFSTFGDKGVHCFSKKMSANVKIHYNRRPVYLDLGGLLKIIPKKMRENTKIIPLMDPTVCILGVCYILAFFTFFDQFSKYFLVTLSQL